MASGPLYLFCDLPVLPFCSFLHLMFIHICKHDLLEFLMSVKLSSVIYVANIPPSQLPFSHVHSVFWYLWKVRFITFSLWCFHCFFFGGGEG